jgi:hypothetical protein
VHERTLDPLSPAERRVAGDLLLRLGHLQRAASVIGLSAIDARGQVLAPVPAAEQLAALRCHLPASAVEAMALRGARSSLPPETRRELALFVVFRNAARGADSASLQAGAALAVKAASELPQNGFTGALGRARLHRAIAAVPFVRRDLRETHRLLGRALESLASATPGDAEWTRWRGRTRPTPCTASSCGPTSPPASGSAGWPTPTNWSRSVPVTTGRGR